MPYKDLGLDHSSQVLGQSRHGVVLQAEYCSMSTAIKLLLPPTKPNVPMLFSPRDSAAHHLSFSTEEILQHYHTAQTGSSLPESPTTSYRTLLDEDIITDIHDRDGNNPFNWHTHLLGQWASLWQLVVAALSKAAAGPAYTISVLSGSRWRQSRMRREVSMLHTWHCMAQS